MLDFIDTLISYVAPHECLACGVEGQLLCSYCRPLLPEASRSCYKCNKVSLSPACLACTELLGLKSLLVRTQYEGFAKELVHRLKFERAYNASEIIALSLAEDFTHLLSQKSVVVPIPTASQRVRERGYDQSVLIAKKFSRHTGLSYAPILTRIGQHRQTGHNRAQRSSQLKDIFEVKDHIRKDQRIILVDDVLTTGATIRSATHALRASGHKHISAIVFARA